MTAPYYMDDLVTLYHGDCHQILEWTEGDVLVTDPPYGMEFRSNMRDPGYRMEAIVGDGDTVSRDDVLAQWGDRPALVFGTWRMPRPENTRQMLVWWKRAAGPGMGDLKMPWGNATEEIYVLGDGWSGTRRANVLVTDDQRGGTNGQASKWGHPTPKPVGLMEQLIEYAPPGVIVDPFAGSGATLVAARNLGRRVVGVEIAEQYCEIIAQRLAQTALW